MAVASEAKGYAGGQLKCFSGNDLDGKAYRQWKTWARAKMMAMKDISKAQRGPFVYCFLDGLTLECVEHLELDDIMSNDDGDGLILLYMEDVG